MFVLFDLFFKKKYMGFKNEKECNLRLGSAKTGFNNL